MSEMYNMIDNSVKNKDTTDKNRNIVTSKTKTTHRVVHYDYLRVLATFAVIMLHTVAQNFKKIDVNGSEWFSFNFYDSIVRWGVPVFIMISGSLLLNREIKISKLYSKYVLRMFVSFIVWSFIYYLFAGTSVSSQFSGLFTEGKAQRILTIIRSHYHLWFVPMIAGIYICIPIIKKIADDKKVGNYFLVLSFVFKFLLPQIVNLINDFGSKRLISVTKALNENIHDMSMNFVMNYVFYFILGYYLSRTKFEKTKRYLIYFLGLCGFIFTIVIDWILTIKTQTPTSTYYGNFCINVLFEAIAVFELCKNIPFKEGKTYRFIVLMSKWSFGAYLVHALILEQLNKVWGINTVSLPFSTFLTVPLISGIVFLCSFVISAILNHIPVLKKYIV